MVGERECVRASRAAAAGPKFDRVPEMPRSEMAWSGSATGDRARQPERRAWSGARTGHGYHADRIRNDANCGHVAGRSVAEDLLIELRIQNYEYLL